MRRSADLNLDKFFRESIVKLNLLLDTRAKKFDGKFNIIKIWIKFSELLIFIKYTFESWRFFKSVEIYGLLKILSISSFLDYLASSEV